MLHICLSVETGSNLVKDNKILVNRIDKYDDLGNIADNADLAINGLYEHYMDLEILVVVKKIDQMFDLYLVDGLSTHTRCFWFLKDGDGYQSSEPHKQLIVPSVVLHSPRKIKTEIERRGGFKVNGFYSYE